MAESTPQAGAAELLSCPVCESHLVAVTAVDLCDGHRWRVERSCAECAWHGADVMSARQVERLGDALAAERAELGVLLATIEHARREEEIEQFARALALDQVLPEDF